MKTKSRAPGVWDKRIFIDGKDFRNRTIETVSGNLVKARDIHRRIKERLWDPWSKRAIALGLEKFWGTANGEPKLFLCERDRFLSKGPDKSVSIRNIDISDLKQIADISEDPPLLLADPRFDSDEGREILEKRFKGKGIPRKQEFADEYAGIHVRFEHVYRVTYLYRVMLTDFVSNRYRDLWGPYTMSTIINLTINGNLHTFFFDQGSKFRLIDDKIEETICGKEMMK